jgi:hypothetical protein
MMTIAIGIVLALFILALLPVIFEGAKWLIGIGLLLSIAYLLIEREPITTIVVSSMVLIAIFTMIGAKVFELKEKFHNSSLIFQFLLIKFLTPGFSDKQKIKQIKKLGELTKYADKKKDEAEIQRREQYLLKIQKNFNELCEHTNKALEEYVKNSYINLFTSPPSPKLKQGTIKINTNKDKSIIQLTNNSTDYFDENKDEYKVEKDSEFFPSYESPFYSRNSKPAAKKAKKYLEHYFKLHPKELK